MTDKEKLQALLTEFGVGFGEYSDLYTEESGGSAICTECGDAKVTGYHRFFTVFVFDKDGKFESMGAWE